MAEVRLSVFELKRTNRGGLFQFIMDDVLVQPELCLGERDLVRLRFTDTNKLAAKTKNLWLNLLKLEDSFLFLSLFNNTVLL